MRDSLFKHYATYHTHAARPVFGLKKTIAQAKARKAKSVYEQK